MTTPHTFNIFADYFQFYVQDEPSQTSLGDAWTDEGVKRMLVAAPGIVGIGTARNDTIPVSVEVFSSKPSSPDLAAWDHVAECSLNIASGKLVIAGSSDYLPDAPRIDVTPGAYRVRVLYGNLNSISADGFEGDDHYSIQLWPQAAGDLVVLKDRNASAPLFRIVALDHVQLAIPPGQEAVARQFYMQALGLREVPKPANLAKRGGLWLEGGALRLHLGVEADFKPAKKAHPALLVQNLGGLIAHLEAMQIAIVRDEPLEGYDRMYVSDPFGNRIEIMEPIG